MDTLLKALDSLRIVLSNPALGGGSSLRTNEASEILRLIITLAQDPTVNGGIDLEGLASVLTTMEKGGRGPTPPEWVNIRGCQAEYDAPTEEETQTEEGASEQPEVVAEASEEKKPVSRRAARAAAKKVAKSEK